MARGLAGAGRPARVGEFPRYLGTCRAPVTETEVKSIIARPADGARVAPGMHKVSGVAWAGEADITRVDLSTDFGRSWVAAELGPEKAKYAWRRFHYNFKPSKIGSYQPLCRATDSQGRSQPVVPNWNPSGYVYNVVDKVRINVEA